MESKLKHSTVRHLYAILTLRIESPKKGNSKMFTISTDSQPKMSINIRKNKKSSDSSSGCYMNMRKSKNTQATNKSFSQDTSKNNESNLKSIQTVNRLNLENRVKQHNALRGSYDSVEINSKSNERQLGGYKKMN